MTRSGKAGTQIPSRFEGLADHLERAFVWEAEADTLRVTYVSSSVEDVLGITSGRCLAIDFWSACSSADDLPALKSALQSADADASVRSCRHRCVAGDGRVVWLHTVVWPIAPEDSGRRLEGVTQEMGASESGSIDGGGRDELLAMLGHELRNPLAPVVAAARMLRIGDKAARERAGIIIERQVERMGRLIDDLLDYADFAAERIQLDVSRFDLRSAVDDAVSEALSAVDRGQYEVGLAQSEEPLWIEADGVRLRQTLTHLLTTVAGCVPSPGRIDIVTGRSGGTAFVEVRDNGAGIPDDLLARVSPSFTYQSQLKGRGRSVRLAVATRIVELHGGSLELTRVEGEGTRFTVRLPLDPEAGPEADGEVSNAFSASGLRPRVLVVDDNVDLAQSLEMLLKEYGYDVRTAYDGAAAIATALEFLPEVVFLDIGLPDVDGNEVAKRLRRHPALRSTMLVALTGYGRQSDRRRSAAAGFDHHLTKPVSFADLQGVLDSRRTLH